MKPLFLFLYQPRKELFPLSIIFEVMVIDINRGGGGFQPAFYAKTYRTVSRVRPPFL